jgi:hypothetical protein
VWGSATLRKIRDGPGALPAVNAFGGVVLEWTVALLNGAAQETPGANLFRKEPAVFGRFLTTLGVFCGCARLSVAAHTLCGAVLTLLLVRVPFFLIVFRTHSF